MIIIIKKLFRTSFGFNSTTNSFGGIANRLNELINPRYLGLSIFFWSAQLKYQLADNQVQCLSILQYERTEVYRNPARSDGGYGVTKKYQRRTARQWRKTGTTSACNVVSTNTSTVFIPHIGRVYENKESNRTNPEIPKTTTKISFKVHRCK